MKLHRFISPFVVVPLGLAALARGLSPRATEPQPLKPYVVQSPARQAGPSAPGVPADLAPGSGLEDYASLRAGAAATGKPAQ